MVIEVTFCAVLFCICAPITDIRDPDCNPPKALSVAVPVPKLKVSPVVEAPVPAANVLLAFVPVSNNFQPAGKTEDVPEVIRVLKFWV